jgi:competence protein ComEC
MILIAVSIGWVAGLLLGAAEVALAPPAVLAALLGLLALRFRARPIVFWVFLAVVAAVVGDARYSAYAAGVRDNLVAGFTQRSVVTLRGVVDDDPVPWSAGDEFPLAVRELERGGGWLPADGLVLVRMSDSAPYRIGDRLEISGVLTEPDPLLPPRESRLRQEGIVAVTTNPTVALLGGWEWSPRAVIGRARENAAGALNRSLPEPEAGLARGIALGQRRTLDTDLSDDFNRTNTSHILAVDGYKVGLIANLVDSLLGLAIQLPLRAVGTVGGIALYAAFVGASPSALRAAIMGSIFAFGRALGRPNDTLAALALAALAITAVMPFLLWNIAFQLSFVTTIGITALAPVFVGGLSHRAGFLREAIGTTIAAEVASAPLIVATFDHVSLASLPVHAVVMPLLPLAIVLSGLTAGLGALVPPIGDAVGWLAWVPLAGIVGIVSWAGSLPLASLPIPPLGLGTVLAIYAGLGLAILSRNNPFFGPGLPLADWARRVSAVVPPRVLVPGIGLPAIVLGAVLFQRAAPVDQIRFLAVTGGDAALVTLAGGPTTYLAGTADAAGVARAVDPTLPLSDRAIDVALLTVDDDPSLTDLTDLSSRLNFRSAVVPVGGFSAVAVSRWRDAAASRQLQVISVDPPGGKPSPTVSLGGRASLAIYPLGGAPKQGRSAALPPSLAARLTIGRAALVWISAEPGHQAELAASGVPLSAQVLKLVGRGARWGLDPSFFQRVNPSIVVLPAGAADRFAKSTPGTLDLLANRRVYRTDLDGTIVISLEADGMRVETARGE